MNRKNRFLLTLNTLLILLVTTAPVLAAPEGDIFIPIVMNRNAPDATGRVVNVPYINAASSQIFDAHKPEMAVFWFGEVEPEDNYTDVRIAYNNTSLVIWTATFDRSLWYNLNSTGSDLENWDSVALTLLTDAGNYTTPPVNSHRFVVGMRHWQDMVNYTRQYQGSGSGWNSVPSNFYASTFWRGELGFNIVPPAGDARNRGWGASIAIPFSALGLSGPPPAGTLWRIHARVYDKDAPSSAISPQVWPESSDLNTPSSWASLRFGIPAYTPPPSKNPVTVELKNKINITAPDAHVGGGMTCGTTQNFFDVWGTLNYKGTTSINIQNQDDIADFACFSKYYITFPLSPLPAGKLIRSAKLRMSVFGGSDPSRADPSYIQAFSVSADWDEATINWNNAPLAQENLSGAWVDVFIGTINWPTIPRYEWDVTRAVERAYTTGQPVRLALYSADKAMHSGKYFVSSDTGADWNARNLPALVIEYVDP